MSNGSIITQRRHLERGVFFTFFLKRNNDIISIMLIIDTGNGTSGAFRDYVIGSFNKVNNIKK